MLKSERRRKLQKKKNYFSIVCKQRQNFSIFLKQRCSGGQGSITGQELVKDIYKELWNSVAASRHCSWTIFWKISLHEKDGQTSCMFWQWSDAEVSNTSLPATLCKWIAVFGEHWDVYKSRFNGLIWIIFKNLDNKIKDHRFYYCKDELYSLYTAKPKIKVIFEWQTPEDFLFIEVIE